MYDLKFQGKRVEELSYEETVEFEKELNRRILSADRVGMSEGIITQLQNYLSYVKLHQREQLDKIKMGLSGAIEKEEATPEEPYSLIIGEPEPEPDDENE